MLASIVPHWLVWPLLTATLVSGWRAPHYRLAQNYNPLTR